MRRKIPSSTSLTAFEAAARHGSFARAAEELSLTEGAISRQIGRLESFLGVPLFERVGNRVRLLPNGERYAAQVRESLDRLDRDLRATDLLVIGAMTDLVAIGCSSLSAWGASTQDALGGDPIVVRNLDWDAMRQAFTEIGYTGPWMILAPGIC